MLFICQIGVNKNICKFLQYFIIIDKSHAFKIVIYYLYKNLKGAKIVVLFKV